ncbi:MAG: fused MFS/spermidine synthase [Bacillota bacterium]
MTLELVASRLVAPVMGVSLYTWTSVIGAVLAGISGGSFIGGWMADRWDARRILGPVMILSGIAAALIIPALPVLGVALPVLGYPILRVAVPILVVFGIPSLCIGLISPILYKVCLNDPSRTGSTVGKLAASGSLGSIAGTFGTGFFLIPTLGTRAIVLGVAGALMLLGVVNTAWRNRTVKAMASCLVISAIAFEFVAQQRAWAGRGVVESAYYSIRISTDEDPVEGKVKKLILDNLIHSAANPEDPEFLWYEYERVSAWLIRNCAKPGMRVLVIGGGGYTLPYWIERHYGDAVVEVVEIDPEVTQIALREFIKGPTKIQTYNEDGRAVFNTMLAQAKYDLVFGDAYNDLSVPYHLTTLEFAQVIRNHLSEDGIYVANIVDKPNGKFLNAFSNTLAQVFPFVRILPGSEAAMVGGRSPHLVVAAFRELPFERWAPTRDVAFPLVARAPEDSQITLTDDYAPVDNLLLPVFAERLSR